MMARKVRTPSWRRCMHGVPHAAPTWITLAMGTVLLLLVALLLFRSRFVDMESPSVSTPPAAKSCTTRGARPLVTRPATYRPERFFIAMAILSVDNDGHATLRSAQRDSWFHYRDMATAAREFQGKVMAEYVVALSFDTNHVFSESLKKEATVYHDILTIPLLEPKRRPKSLMTRGVYGHAAEVVMSLKSLAYYCYAERTYTKAKFVVKVDDDQFIRIPMLVQTAMALPSSGVLWGPRTKPKLRKSGSERICGISGMLLGQSLDVLKLLNRYEPIQKYARVALDDVKAGVTTAGETLEWIYKNTPLYAEDVTPAAHVHMTSGEGENMHIDVYYEPRCRAHDHESDRTGNFIHHVNPRSMIIHHTNHSQQLQYMRLFPEDSLHEITFSSSWNCSSKTALLVNVCKDPSVRVHLTPSG